MAIYEAKITYSRLAEGPAFYANSPQAVADYMRGAIDDNPMQEQLWVLLLNRKNCIIGRMRVGLGASCSCLVSPSDVFRPAILAGVTAIVLVHNHPGRDPLPSGGDMAATCRIREAGKTIDIDLLDHVVIGERDRDPSGIGYYSFRDAGLL